VRTLLDPAARLRELEAHLGRRLRRLRARMWLAAVAGGVTVIAFVFLAAALFLLLAQHATAWVAAAVTGAVTAAVAGALLWIARSMSQRALRDYGGGGPRRHEADAAAGGAGDALEEWLSHGNLRAGDLVLTSLVAGVVLGASPRLRREIGSRVARRRGDRSRAR
jgi:uncharacterized membrane protein